MSESQLTLWGKSTGADLHGEIKEQGFALVEYGVSADRIDELIAAYADFTDSHPDPELSTMNDMIVNTSNLDKLNYDKDTQSEWHKYRSHSPHFAKPNGYTSRTLQANALQAERGIPIEDDPKEYFHYSPVSVDPFTRKRGSTRELLEARHEMFDWGPIPPELTRLTSRMHGIHHAAKLAMKSVYGKLEVTHPELTRFVTPDDLDISPVRLLFYHNGQGKVLANGHHDRGLGTLQIAESHQGLRVRNPETGDMDMVERDAKYGVAFPALKWRQANPNSELRSLWHDVINIDTPNPDRHLHGRNVARWALIFFTNSTRLGEQTAKTAAHTEDNRFVS